jgi:hypothetical protein
MANTDLSNDVNPSQHKHHKDCKPGLPNYQNTKLIPIIERILPNCSDAYHLVAVAYKKESGKNAIQIEEDLHRNWVRMLWNNFKKPTAATVEIAQRIHCCIDIERCTQHQTNSGILRASSGEDCEYLNNYSSEDKLDAAGDLNVNNVDTQSYTENKADVEGDIDTGISPALYLPIPPPDSSLISWV